MMLSLHFEQTIHIVTTMTISFSDPYINSHSHFFISFQLAYCVVQFLEKDPTLTEPVSLSLKLTISKAWPGCCSTGLFRYLGLTSKKVIYGTNSTFYFLRSFSTDWPNFPMFIRFQKMLFLSSLKGKFCYSFVQNSAIWISWAQTESNLRLILIFRLLWVS